MSTRINFPFFTASQNSTEWKDRSLLVTMWVVFNLSQPQAPRHWMRCEVCVPEMRALVHECPRRAAGPTEWHPLTCDSKSVNDTSETPSKAREAVQPLLTVISVSLDVSILRVQSARFLKPGHYFPCISAAILTPHLLLENKLKSNSLLLDASWSTSWGERALCSGSWKLCSSVVSTFLFQKTNQWTNPLPLQVQQRDQCSLPTREPVRNGRSRAPP